MVVVVVLGAVLYFLGLGLRLLGFGFARSLGVVGLGFGAFSTIVAGWALTCSAGLQGSGWWDSWRF